MRAVGRRHALRDHIHRGDDVREAFALAQAFANRAIAAVPRKTGDHQIADPAQPLFWSSSQNKDFDKKAVAKLNAERHLGTERMLDSAFVAFRNGNGEAELHEKQADLLLIRSGEGTVLVGGKIVGGGLPVGVFGGKRQIMDMLAPLGPIETKFMFGGTGFYFDTLHFAISYGGRIYFRVDGATARGRLRPRP